MVLEHFLDFEIVLVKSRKIFANVWDTTRKLYGELGKMKRDLF
jgi:hypothetical protein